MVRPFTATIIRQPKEEVKSIPTIIGKDWAIVNGEFFEFTEEEKKQRRSHVR